MAIADLTLKTAIQTLGHTQALKDGTVTPRGFAFAFEEVTPIIQAFRRMVRGREFDVSEMAITTYMCARAHGKRLTAIPVFLMRAFHHGVILVNTTQGITHPKELEGRKVGVNRGYTVTAGVWARSVLQHEYGVDLRKITWVLSGDEHVQEFRPPAHVVSIEEGTSLDALLVSGEIAAAIGATVSHPDVAPLIPNAFDVGLQALAAKGYYPINHTLVVKDELLAVHPGLAVDLFDCFVAAKRLYVERLRTGGIAEPTKTDHLYQRVMAVTGGDPLPYGVAPNRAMVEAIVRHAGEQGIIPHPYRMEELFAAGTIDCVG